MYIFVTKSAEETLAVEEGQQHNPHQANPPSRKVSNLRYVNRSTDDNRVLSPTVAKYRSIIERTFKRIKSWLLLKNRSQMSGDTDRLENIIKVIIGLENWSQKWRLVHNQAEMNENL